MIKSRISLQNEQFTSLPFAEWHILAMAGVEDAVIDGMKTFNVYYDGQLYTSVSHPTTLVSFFTFDWIFAGLTSYNVCLSQYRGTIDDICFFKRSLDSDEINLLYQQQ